MGKKNKRNKRTKHISEQFEQVIEDRPDSVILEALVEGMLQYFNLYLSKEAMKGHKEN